MKLFLVVCATVLLIQAFLETVAAVPTYQISKTTQYKFTIDHSLILSYNDDLQRDATLQKIFAFWKTVLSQYKTANLSIQLLQTADGLGAGSHIVQYRVAGDSAVEISLQEVTTQFDQQLPSANISGVQTLSSLSAGIVNDASIQGPGGLISYTVDIDSFISYKTAADRDRILQQILNLWTTTFSANQFTDLHVKFLSEKPSNISGTKQVSYRITGRSQGEVDIKSLVSVFLPALQSAGVSGVVIPTGNGFPSGVVENNWIVDSYLSYKTSDERDQLLQEILFLWKTVFASYQISDLSISIVKEGPSSGPNTKLVTYKITGKTRSATDNANLTTTFLSSLKSAHIAGVQVVSVNSGSVPNQIVPEDNNGAVPFSFAVDVDATFNAGSTSDTDDVKNKILDLFNTHFASNGYSDIKITLLKDKPSSTGSRQITYLITGYSNQVVDLTNLLTSFLSVLQSSELPGVQFSSHEDESVSHTNEKLVAGPNIHIENNVILTYSTPAQLNQLLQQILEIWKTTVGSANRFTNLHITMITSRPNGSGGKYVTYRIEGNSDSSFDWNQYKVTFESAIKTAQIPNIKSVDTVQTTRPVTAATTGWSWQNNDASSSADTTATTKATVVPVSRVTATKKRVATTATTPVTTKRASSVTTATTPVSVETSNNGCGGMGMNQGQSMNGGGMSQSQSQSQGQSDGGCGNDNNQIGKNGDSQLVVVPGNGGYAPGSGPISGDGSVSSKFTIEDQVLIQYDTQANLYRTLQQLMAYWKTVFSTSQLTNVKIVFVRAEPAADAKYKTVYYRITGQSATTIDSTQAMVTFNSALQQSKSVVNVVVAPQYATVTTTDAGGQEDVTTSEVNGAPIDVQDSVFLTYSGTSQRDALLAKILSLFQTTLTSYQLSNVKIVYVRDVPGANGSRQVYFRITGTVAKAKNGDVTMAQLQSAVQNGKQAYINGIKAESSVSVALVPVSYNDFVVLTYSTDAQRDSLLQRVLDLFKTTFSSYQLNPLEIVFLNEVVQSDGSRKVFFKITGQSGKQFDYQSAVSQFQAALTAKGDNDIRAANGAVQVKDSSRIPFDYTQKVFLAYDVAKDRDEFIKRLGVIWRNTLHDYLPSADFKVVYVSEKKNVGKLPETSSSQTRNLNEVTYRLTGATQRPFNIDDVSAVFRQTAQDAHLAGVTFDQSWTVDGNGATASKLVAGGPFEIRDSAYLTYSGNAQRDALLAKLLSLFQTTFTSYELSNVKIVYDRDIAGPAGARQVYFRIIGNAGQAVDVSSTSIQLQSAIQNAKINGIQAMNTVFLDTTVDFSDSIVLSYSTSAERDALLQKILARWKTVLSQYQVSNLKISYVSDTSAKVAGGRIVKYRITGVRKVEFTLQEVVKLFIASLQTSPIAGVGLLVDDKAAPAVVSSGQIGGSLGNNLVGGNGQQFSIPGSVLLTYRNDQQRQTFLDQIMVMWRNTIWDSLVSGVAIKMTSESGSGQTKTVNYVITGASTNPIDIDDARRRFNQLLRDSNLTGVQPVDAPPPPNNDAQGQELPDSGQRGWTNMIPDSQ